MESRARIKYLTKELLAKATKGAPDHSVTELNLSSADDEYKIPVRSYHIHIDLTLTLQTIENIQPFVQLQSLVLSHNVITKLAHMEALVHVRILDLSYNRLESLHHIEVLRSLEQLNVEHNALTSLPHTLSKLGSLSSMRLAYNQIPSLKELDVLLSLPNLSLITTLGNPLASVPHARAYIAFLLPTLNMLVSCCC